MMIQSLCDPKPPPNLFAQQWPRCWLNTVAVPSGLPESPVLAAYMVCQLYA